MPSKLFADATMEPEASPTRGNRPYHGVKKILVLRNDHIGDAVLFSGALQYIRRHWPDACIELAVKPEVVDLYQLCPHIDRVRSIEFLQPWTVINRIPKRIQWRVEPLLRSRGLAWLRKIKKYDLLFCPVSSPGNDLLGIIKDMRAKEKWGYSGDSLSLDRATAPILPEQVFTSAYENRLEDRWVHELKRTSSFLGHFGITHDDLWPQFWTTREDVTFARNALPEGPNIGIFVGATTWWRKWPNDKWASLVSQLAPGSRCVILGGKGDQADGMTIRRMVSAGMYVVDLTGKTTLRQLIECVRRCKAVISTDSSGLHIATALRLPTVGMMAGHHFGRFYPWGDSQINRVSTRTDLCEHYHCNYHCVHSDYRCMHVTVDHVLEELSMAVTHAGIG